MPKIHDIKGMILKIATHIIVQEPRVLKRKKKREIIAKHKGTMTVPIIHRIIFFCFDVEYFLCCLLKNDRADKKPIVPKININTSENSRDLNSSEPTVYELNA
ncbi:MAG: hypothetical protein WCL02_07985 [bacterium]